MSPDKKSNRQHNLRVSDFKISFPKSSKIYLQKTSKAHREAREVDFKIY